MSKLPAFQFYPGDWVQDTRCLSLSAKGAWIDLLCAMWRSQSRGELSLPIVGYARIIGATVEQTEAVIAELTDMQILDNVTSGNGNVTLRNRRMVREEKQRISTRLRVEKFRNETDKRTSNTNVTVPSSSSSSSSKKEKKVRKKRFSELNEDFWSEVRKIYTYLDIDQQISKMKGYMLRNPKWKMNRRSVINWLNKEEKPIEIPGGGNGSKPQHPDFIIDQGLRGKDNTGTWWVQKKGEWIIEKEA